MEVRIDSENSSHKGLNSLTLLGILAAILIVGGGFVTVFFDDEPPSGVQSTGVLQELNYSDGFDVDYAANEELDQ